MRKLLIHINFSELSKLNFMIFTYKTKNCIRILENPAVMLILKYPQDNNPEILKIFPKDFLQD